MLNSCVTFENEIGEQLEKKGKPTTERDQPFRQKTYGSKCIKPGEIALPCQHSNIICYHSLPSFVERRQPMVCFDTTKNASRSFIIQTQHVFLWATEDCKITSPILKLVFIQVIHKTKENTGFLPKSTNTNDVKHLTSCQENQRYTFCSYLYVYIIYVIDICKYMIACIHLYTHSVD